MANFNLIRKFAKENGMTLALLAEKVGITPAGLNLLMNSNSTNTTTIEKIAQVLDVKVGVFFDEPDPATNDLPQELKSVLFQKDEIIAQKDKIIAQKDEVIKVLAAAVHNV